MSRKRVGTLIAVCVALAAHVGVAHAQAARASAGVTATDPRVSTLGPNDPRLHRLDPRDPRLLQIPPATAAPAPLPGESGREPHRSRHQPTVVIVTQPIVIGAAPSACWIPGRWEYRWVPATSSYSAWIPGQWSPDGRWIEGRYESSVTSSGSWQPVWVEGAWAC